MVSQPCILGTGLTHKFIHLMQNEKGDLDLYNFLEAYVGEGKAHVL